MHYFMITKHCLKDVKEALEAFNESSEFNTLVNIYTSNVNMVAKT